MHISVISSCIFTIICVTNCTDEVPVVVWGSGSTSFNYHIPAFRKLTTSEFHEDFLRKLISNEPNAIAVFVEESLSIEDFAPRGSNEMSAYPLLQQQVISDSNSIFLPYVMNPVKAFNSLTYSYYKISESGDGVNTSKIVSIVKLDDVQEKDDRLKLLNRHDKLIYELCSKIQQKYEKATCVLTGERPSWIEPQEMQSTFRKLLESPDVNITLTSSPMYYFLEDVGLIYTQGAPVLINTQTNETYTLTGSLKPTKQGSSDGMSVKFTNAIKHDTVHLVFNFQTDNVSWSIDSIDARVSDKVNSLPNVSGNRVSASLGNSFHTPSIVKFSNPEYTLIFTTLQAQYKPFACKFGPAEDTVYFFTIPILSGLFVSSFFIAIVLFGLSMIFDIKTMDQFDDPKGKSITINASE